MGEVAAFELSTCVQPARSPRKDIADSKVVLVHIGRARCRRRARHGHAEHCLEHFRRYAGDLPRVVAKLAKAGVRRVVITADHGFISLSRRLDDAYKIDAPKGGSGELHRRAWIGRGGIDHPSVSASRSPRQASDRSGPPRASRPRPVQGRRLEAVLSRRTLAAGARHPCHGRQPRRSQRYRLDQVRRRCRRRHSISTAMSSRRRSPSAATCSRPSVVVRAIARRGKDLVVAHVVKGDGFDPRQVRDVPASNEVRLMFQVTKPARPEGPGRGPGA